MTNTKNATTKSTLSEKSWKTGWRRWCRFDSLENCKNASEEAGYKAAAASNEAGGARPTSSEVHDAWDDLA